MKEMIIDFDLLIEDIGDVIDNKELCETVKSLIETSQIIKSSFQNKDLMKKYHFCTQCGKQDAYTISGRSLCSNCCEKANKHYSDNKAHISDIISKRRKDRIENGICVYCGKEKADIGYKSCTECRKKDNSKNKYRRRKKAEEKRIIRDSLNLCHKCGKNEKLKDKLVCQSCYDMLLPRMEKARATVNRDNHCWRADNKIVFRKKGETDEK